MMADTNTLYRLRGGEVLKIAKKRADGSIQTFEKRDQAIYGVIADANLPDGTDVRDMSTNPVGPMRQLGFAKIFIAPNTVRNATQAEIDTFAAAQQTDRNNQDAEQAGDRALNDPFTRRLISMLFKAMNRIRSDAGLTEWTPQQIRNFIENNISPDD